MATVVLPVLRSPMISSRWPRPIGVIASIDLMPGLQRLVHGLAADDAGRLDLHAAQLRCRPASPLPSIGSPSALTTRPSTPSPTGTERMRPVALTVWPSSMRVDVAEHDGADRVLVEVEGEADGAVLELEQLVHGGVGQARHAGDAVADLGDAADGAGLERGLEALEVLLERRRDVGGGEGEFSHALSCVPVRDGDLSWSRRVRTLPSMTVSPTVATRPPSTDGSTITLRLTCLPVALARAAASRSCWSSVSGDGAAHLGDRQVLGARRPGHQVVDDGRQVAAAAGADDHRDELRRGRRGLAAEQVLDDRLALAGRDRLVGERAAQRVARLVRAGEAEQLVLDLVERALGAGDLEQRPGVAVDTCVAHDVPRTHLLDEVPRCRSLLRGGVDRAVGEHPIGGLAGEPGDLGPQLVADPAAGRRDVGVGPGLEVGDLLLEPGPAVGEQRLGLGVGVGEQAGPLGLDVAGGLADRGRLGCGLGLGRRRSRRARPGSSRCGRPSPS